MGISTTPQQLVRKVNAAAANIERSSERAALVGARTVKATVLAETTKATGGDLRLSGVRSKRNPQGAKLGVSYDTRSGANVLVSARGPYQLVENDTPPHDIAPRQSKRPGRRRRRTGAKALLIGGGFYASAKQTGGSKGRHPWRDGVEVAKPLVRREFALIETRAIRDAFG